MAFEYATKLYLNAVSGDDTNGDGTEENPWQFFDTSPAKTLVEAGVEYQYEVFFMAGSSENITLDLTATATTFSWQPFVKFTALNSDKFEGTGNFITINNSTVRYWGVWLNGFNVVSYDKVLTSNSYRCGSIFESCVIKDTIIDGDRSANLVFDNTILENVVFENSMVDNSPQFQLHCIIDSKFINVSTLQSGSEFIMIFKSDSNFDQVGGYQEACFNNHFKDMNLSIRISATDYIDFENNNYENVNIAFFDTTDNMDLPTNADLVAITSVSELRDLYYSTFGETTELYETETFITQPVDSYLYPTDKSLYVNNVHRGALKFAQTTEYGDFTVLQNGQITGGFLERLSTGTDAVFESDFLEFPEPEFPHCIVVHYEDTSTVGGELANPNALSDTDRKIGIELMYSAKKTAAELEADPEPYKIFYTGLQSENLLYDLIPGKVKSYKFRITLKDEGDTPTAGTFQIKAVTLTTRDGVLPEVSNILPTEHNSGDPDLSIPKINNIMLAGTIIAGKVQLYRYGTSEKVQGATVKVMVGETEVSSSISDTEGNATFDYYLNATNRFVVQHSDYELGVFEFTQETFVQFNGKLDLKPRIEAIIGHGEVFLNPSPDDPLSDVFV